MYEISTNIVLNGITKTISDAFPTSNIYCEDVSQGLIPKDFIVTLIAVKETQLLGEQYQISPTFSIQYFPELGKAECYEVSDKLFSLLKLISLEGGSKIRGIGMQGQVVDNVLNMTILCPYKTRVLKDEELMMSLKTVQEV